MNKLKEWGLNALRLLKSNLLWLRNNRQDIWTIAFSITVIWFGVSLRHTQQQGRKDRIATAAGLAQTQAATAVSLANAQIASARRITEVNQKQNEALKQGEILVCTKALGVITGIIALSVTGNASHPVHLTRGQQIAINAYLALANPKQCPQLVNPAK